METCERKQNDLFLWILTEERKQAIKGFIYATSPKEERAADAKIKSLKKIISELKRPAKVKSPHRSTSYWWF